VRRVSYAAGVAIVATAFVLLAACQQATTTPAVSTTKWASDGNGNLEFITNDSSYYNYYFWDKIANAAENNSANWTNPVTATVEKVSGSSTEGFGVVFCAQSSNNDFYFVDISANGEYYVGQDVSNSISAITKTGGGSGWAQSTAIKQGNNAANVVSIALSSSTYAISINGTQVCTFPASNATNGYMTGSSGFTIVIGTSSDESFPGTPEKALFKFTSPATYP